ncbi:hypothetical protein N9L94_01165 [Robiginitalea sp.]|nr:hypothetical protein [Robiginitalea sp.]
MPIRDLIGNSAYESKNYSSVPGDTPGGGWTQRPSQVFPPSDVENASRTGGPDFLLRGGYLLPRQVVRDTSLILKKFTQTQGVLFTIKQNVLSLTNVNSNVGYTTYKADESPTLNSVVGGFIKDVGPNQGIYTPLSTLAQSALTPLGVHLNKQGLNPFKGTTKGSEDGNTPLGLPTYLNTIASSVPSEPKSRLLSLRKKIDNKSNDNLLYSYSGGPDATLGVGKTAINMLLDQRTGINNDKLPLLNTRFNPGQLVERNVVTGGKSLINTLSARYLNIFEPTTNRTVLIQRTLQDIIDFTARDPSVYEAGTLLKTNTDKLKSGIKDEIPIQVLTQAQTEAFEPTSKTNLIPTPYFQIVAPNGSQQIPKGLDLTISSSIVNGVATTGTSLNRIESRVNLGDPGRRGNLQSFTIGKLGLNQDITGQSAKSNSSYKKAVDKINAFPLYKSSGVTANNDKNDLVKFRIGVFANDGSGQKTYVHFRALIDGFSDTFTSDWDAQKFMGRGENFYRYSGFDRTVSLSWTVAAQSKQELIPMHQKLNYLASACAPDYSSQGYMQGNLISLTVGGWFQEQVGIMKGLSLSVPSESPWEIAIPDSNNISVINPTSPNTAIKTDPSVKELPMIINVSGFEFIPIHDFVPRVQHNNFKGSKLTKFGKQHYINLAAATGNNYDGQGDNINYIQK